MRPFFILALAVLGFMGIGRLFLQEWWAVAQILLLVTIGVCALYTGKGAFNVMLCLIFVFFAVLNVVFDVISLMLLFGHLASRKRPLFFGTEALWFDTFAIILNVISPVIQLAVALFAFSIYNDARKAEMQPCGRWGQRYSSSYGSGQIRDSDQLLPAMQDSRGSFFARSGANGQARAS